MRSARIALTAAALTAATACQPTPTTDPAGPAPTGTAVDQLAALPIRVEDTGAHYHREAWGDWTHHGHGCDTRDVLLRDQGRNTTPGKGCTTLCPTTAPPCWTSPYDGAQLRDPGLVQIDHRVPVKEAVRSGARDWSREQRQRFYNDPGNLVAVSAHANTSKGDKDPARWRPSQQDSWCAYASAYIATKTSYHLAVDPPEHDALAAMLTTCRDQR